MVDLPTPSEWAVCKNGGTEKGERAHRRLREECEHPFSCPSSLACVWKSGARAVYVVEESSAHHGPANRPRHTRDDHDRPCKCTYIIKV